MQAQCTKTITPLLQGADRAILLSGTPALSKPAELLPQMQALLPGAKLTIAEFAERYCLGDQYDRLKGANNLEELNMVLVRSPSPFLEYLRGPQC